MSEPQPKAEDSQPAPTAPQPKVDGGVRASYVKRYSEVAEMLKKYDSRIIVEDQGKTILVTCPRECCADVREIVKEKPE